MRRWDVVTGISGAIAILAFALLVAVMVNPEMAGFSALAFAALAAGVLGITVGITGMSREMKAENPRADTDDGVFALDRLGVYRHLQRNRSREFDQ
ncbi:MAG: hypothetical protein M3O62_18960 [Pseudomonadota bacterium]|nr:hypothetical protein [Pseudomonadota bacterium]